MRKTLIFFVLVVQFSLLVASAQAQPAEARPFQYMVKFVCGWRGPAPPVEDQQVKPGNYATAINIYNHNRSGVVGGAARVALWYRTGFPPPPLVTNFAFTVVNRRVLEIDCLDVWIRSNIPPGTFLKGMVHVGLDQRLEVVAVYTSQTHDNPNAGPDPGAGHSIDVEYVKPLIVPIAP